MNAARKLSKIENWDFRKTIEDRELGFQITIKDRELGFQIYIP